MVKVIGLTGSIAVGKSTVTHYLLTHGYQVVDADEISRHALDQGTACYDQVKEKFDCLDCNGNVDRKKLGQIVFYEASKKQQLENIIHPYVIEEMKKAIALCQDEIIFLDVPLLFEIHLEYLCDQIVVVYVDEKTQCERLMKRNQMNENEAMNLIKQQISIEKKKTMGDYVLNNQQNFEDLYQNIERVLKEIKDEVIYE